MSSKIENLTEQQSKNQLDEEMTNVNESNKSSTTTESDKESVTFSKRKTAPTDNQFIAYVKSVSSAIDGLAFNEECYLCKRICATNMGTPMRWVGLM